MDGARIIDFPKPRFWHTRKVRAEELKRLMASLFADIETEACYRLIIETSVAAEKEALLAQNPLRRTHR